MVYQSDGDTYCMSASSTTSQVRTFYISSESEEATEGDCSSYVAAVVEEEEEEGRYIQCVFVPQFVLDHLAATYPEYEIEDVSCESDKNEIDLDRSGSEYEYSIEYDLDWNITDIDYKN